MPDGTIYLWTPAHAPGQVEVAVSNQDGERSVVPGGFTFVAPESLDLAGTWVGCAGDHCHLSFGFTIEKGLLTSVSCDGTSYTFTAPPSTRSGQFAVSEQGVTLSGKFFSDNYALGTVKFGPCCSSRPDRSFRSRRASRGSFRNLSPHP